MNRRLAYLREQLSTSIWFIPLVFCLSSIALGLVMLSVDRDVSNFSISLITFSMPVSTAREVLSVIAGAVIGVGGVTFSITMVALTLTSGQYGPKVLRQFLEGNSSKISLGLFLGSFLYSLVVLVGFKQSDNPHLTVLVALLLALFAIIGFIHFIHRTATDLQADHIVERIGNRLRDALSQLVDHADMQYRSTDVGRWRRVCRAQDLFVIASNHNGYVQTIDYRGLTRWCEEHDCVMQVRVRPGDFLIDGSSLYKISGCPADVIDDAYLELNNHVIVGPVRTSAQDPEYPITQLNQLAARALSPGINDPGTAISCIDWFSLALTSIVDRDIPGSVFLDNEHRPRLLARTPNFAGILKGIFSPLRQFAKNEATVIVGLFNALCRLAELTTRPDRLAALGRHGELLWEEISDSAFSGYDFRDIQQRYRRLQALTRRLQR